MKKIIFFSDTVPKRSTFPFERWTRSEQIVKARWANAERTQSEWWAYVERTVNARRWNVERNLVNGECIVNAKWTVGTRWTQIGLFIQ